MTTIVMTSTQVGVLYPTFWQWNFLPLVIVDSRWTWFLFNCRKSRHLGRTIEASRVPFVSLFKKLVESGNSTRSWLDTWAGDSPLATKFSSWIKIALLKTVVLAVKPLSFMWEWRHLPRGREFPEFEELLSLLQQLPPFPARDDTWTSAGSSSGTIRVWDLAVSLDRAWTYWSSIPTLWCELLP